LWEEKSLVASRNSREIWNVGIAFLLLLLFLITVIN